MNLSEATWTDAADAAGETDLALLPVGSTEQHGPHAPLGTDAIAAETVAERAADSYENEVVVAPTIPVGVAEEHRGFAGTMWATPDTFRAYVRDCARSLAHHGFDRIALVNGHGGNVAALREVAARLTRDGTATVAAFTWFDAADAPDMGHGGPVETSLLAHVAPEHLRADRYEDAAAGAADRWGEWVGGTNVAYDADAFTESGVVGDPRAASAERGAELLDDAAAALRKVLDALERRADA